jgi:drug/metabolite transporter (DMT)-like permease
VSAPIGQYGDYNRRALLTVVLGASCISASAILIQLAGTGPATTAFYRCVLALPVLVPLLVLEQRRRGPRPLRARLGAAAAGVFLAVDFMLWNHAITALGAGVATVVGNLQVLFVALAAWLLFGERPRRNFLIALPIVMAGVVLVSGLVGTAAAGIDPLAGIGYGIGTSVAYAGFLLIMRRSSARTPHVAAPLTEATASVAVTALVLGSLFGGVQFATGWPALGWLLVLAMSSQTVGWLIITSALPKVPAAIASLLLLLQPAVAMVLAWLVLGERPSLAQVAGAVAVCVGVVIASRTAGQRAEPGSSASPATGSAGPATGSASPESGSVSSASAAASVGLISSSLASSPLTKAGDASVDRSRASDTASLIATPSGTSSAHSSS